MNATRLVFFFGCYLWFAPIGSAADQLLRREGRFVRLITDLESEDEAQRLVESFDAAVPQWIRFWSLSESDFSNFQVEACVMQDRTRFEREGLLPARVPEFPFGYALGQQIWVLAQQSEYYTRHLMLHEGVHAFAFAAFGGAGPTWYQEGTAELLATHRGLGGDLQVNQLPLNRDDVPHWGRFKLMDQLRDEGRTPSLAKVMQFQPDLKGDVATYGWSWAATMILQAYPEYRDAFFAAARNGRTVGPGFNRQLLRSLQDQWPILAARWRVMCNDLDYGFDWSRERVALSVKDPMWDGKTISVSVAADQGWQSIGYRIPRGVSIRLEPSGEVTLAKTTRPWLSQPPGITFEYHRGRPLGQLLLCVLPNAIDIASDTIAPLPIQAVTTETMIEVPEYSWLLFRVNDDVGRLADNEGHYQVVVSSAGSR